MSDAIPYWEVNDERVLPETLPKVLEVITAQENATGEPIDRNRLTFACLTCGSTAEVKSPEERDTTALHLSMPCAESHDTVYFLSK